MSLKKVHDKQPDKFEFTKENYADWNDVANRDVITPTCEITRQNNQPLFNYVYQSSYYDNQDADCNIEWKQGGYDEPGTWYNGLSNAMGGSLGYQINSYGNNIATLHILDSDLYFELEFSFWQSDSGGGFDAFEPCQNSAPHTWLNLTGGSIGQGGPVSVGAAVACPEKQIVSLLGDGAAMYTLQALWTQARETLNVTTIIYKNEKYRILEIEYWKR